MSTLVAKGHTVPGLGLCIGWYTCLTCKREHQVFRQESQGICLCGDLWRSLAIGSIHDEPAGAAVVSD
jgi:hypothetical protein